MFDTLTQLDIARISPNRFGSVHVSNSRKGGTKPPIFGEYRPRQNNATMTHATLDVW